MDLTTHSAFLHVALVIREMGGIGCFVWIERVSDDRGVFGRDFAESFQEFFCLFEVCKESEVVSHHDYRVKTVRFEVEFSYRREFCFLESSQFADFEGEG